MTIDVTDIRRIQNEANARQEIEEREKRLREHRQSEAKRLAILSQAKELFEPVLEEIKKEAAAGRNFYRHSYGEDTRYGSVHQDSRWKADAIEEEARLRGFKTAWRKEDHDMGDSAAPCLITSYWLEISW